MKHVSACSEKGDNEDCTKHECSKTSENKYCRMLAISQYSSEHLYTKMYSIRM